MELRTRQTRLTERFFHLRVDLSTLLITGIGAADALNLAE